VFILWRLRCLFTGIVWITKDSEVAPSVRGFLIVVYRRVWKKPSVFAELGSSIVYSSKIGDPKGGGIALWLQSESGTLIHLFFFLRYTLLWFDQYAHISRSATRQQSTLNKRSVAVGTMRTCCSDSQYERSATSFVIVARLSLLTAVNARFE